MISGVPERVLVAGLVVLAKPFLGESFAEFFLGFFKQIRTSFTFHKLLLEKWE